MSKIYYSGNIALKIDNLAKREHHFIDVRNNTRHASIDLKRKDKNINFMLNTKESKHNKSMFKDIVNCYNQFIENNKKFNDYKLYFLQLKNLDFDVYAIKKNFSSPIKIVTKEQLNELDENNISYFNYIDTSKGFEKFNKNNINCFINNNNIFPINTLDELKNNIFFIEDKKIIKKTEIDNFSTLQIIFHLKDDFSDKTDEYISIPSIKVFNSDSKTKRKINLIDYHTYKSYDDYSGSFNNPLDLSRIDNKIFNSIEINYDMDKNTLLKSLETIKNIKNVYLDNDYVDFLDIKLNPLKETTFSKKYDINNLLNEIKGQQNELNNE